MLERKEKLMVYCAVALVAIIIIIVIVMIWMPSNKESVNYVLTKYNTEKSYEKERIQYYKDNILNILNESNFKNYYDKIDSKFLEEQSLSDLESVMDYLKSNMFVGSNIMLESVDLISKANDEYVFRITYSISGNTRYLILREEKVNDFSIYFSQTGLVKDIVKEKIIEMDEVEYKFNIVESTLNGMKIKLTVTNNSVNRYEFDFSNLYSVRLITEDNSSYNLSSIALNGNDIYYLNPNSSFTIELVYEISQEQQSKIKRIIFNEANVNDIKQDIVLDY